MKKLGPLAVLTLPLIYCGVRLVQTGRWWWMAMTAVWVFAMVMEIVRLALAGRMRGW